MEKFKQEGTPFRQELVPSGYPTARVRALKGNEQKVIRQESFEDNKVVQRYQAAQKEFRRLERKYGVAVAKTDLVIGKDRLGQPKLFIVVDKIEGESLGDIQKLHPDSAEVLDLFFTGLTKYFLDAYINRSIFWDDYSLFQAMYGNKYNDPEKRVYIVDVDPYFSDYGPLSIKSQIFSLASGVIAIESKFSHPIKLTRSREELMRIIERLLQDKEKQDNFLDFHLRKVLEKLQI